MLLNYNILELISEGSFGKVFKAQHKRTKELVAIKFDCGEKADAINTLKNEAKIYYYLKDKNCFPMLRGYGVYNKQNYLIISLLGDSLAKRVQQLTKFSPNTALLLGIQMINILEVLHNHDLLHRDLKPSNFLFGLNTNKQANKLLLIDFGLSKRYNYDGTHIPIKTNKNIIGSPNFVSINVHKNVEPSRRDDLESCLYIMLYMLSGNLAWFSTNTNTILELKLELTNDASVIPNWLKVLLVYVRQLQFNEKPNYQHLIKIMQLQLITNNIDNIIGYDWD
jgi:serine/threonine protein kinase